jgi:diguanylate cyclase (GGDEF)-like protein/PAS domain S-box-containing protein
MTGRRNDRLKAQDLGHREEHDKPVRSVAGVPLMGLVATTLLLLVMGTTYHGLGSVRRSNDLAGELDPVLWLHQEDRILRHALHADVVMAVSRTAGEDPPSIVMERRDRIQASIERLQANLSSLRSKPVPEAHDALVGRAVAQVLAYVDDAGTTVDLAATDGEVALQRLRSLEDHHTFVSRAEADAAVQLTGSSRRAHADLARAQRAAWRNFKLILPVGLFLLAVGAVLLERAHRRDVRSRQALQEAKQQAVADREFLSALLESLEDGIVACDEQGRLTMSNRAAENLHGMPLADCPVEQWAERFDLHRPDGTTRMPPEEVPLLRALNGERLDGIEMVIAPRTGPTRHVHATARPIVDDDGTRRGAVVSMHDITDRKAAEDELSRRAFIDPLSGLPNRSLLADRIIKADHRFDRIPFPLWLLLLDIDGFKTINDSLGHATGDELLRAVAARLRVSVRRADTVARLGGDEFAVLIEGGDDAEMTAARLLTVLRRPIQLSGGAVRITASMGLAGTNLEGVDGSELLRAADMAMYAAKAKGRNRFEVFRPDMIVAAERRHQLNADLKDAIEQGQLVLHYQPQVDLLTGEVVGVEALVRWQHPERGLIPPDAFIQLAEETGQIIDIDDWVLRTACRQVIQWSRPRRPLRLAVNLSGRHFQGAGVVDRVRAAVNDTSFQPRLLEIEITETAAVHEADAPRAALQELRSTGMSIAIDDFGTGYSILSRMRDFPLDTLKIDRSFIHDIREADDTVPLVSVMIAMAHDLGLGIVAEGIETPEQLRWLQQAGCEVGQGYLLSRPVEAASIPPLLETSRLTPSYRRVERVVRPGP